MIDVVMTITTCVMGYAMVPQVMKSFKDKQVEMAWQTLVLTTTGIIVMIICFWLLNLKINVIANSFLTILWGSLIVMKLIFKKA
jgi:uncharacterized protein YacL